MSNANAHVAHPALFGASSVEAPNNSSHAACSARERWLALGRFAVAWHVFEARIGIVAAARTTTRPARPLGARAATGTCFTATASRARERQLGPVDATVRTISGRIGARCTAEQQQTTCEQREKRKAFRRLHRVRTFRSDTGQRATATTERASTSVSRAPEAVRVPSSRLLQVRSLEIKSGRELQQTLFSPQVNAQSATCCCNKAPAHRQIRFVQRVGA
jgi:hypothetical protein